MPPRGKKAGKDPLLGALIERRWRILDQIGSGGMGIVYRAERVHLGKQVALKFLHASVAESKQAVARFEREAKAVSRLHHVNCVSILDFGVYRKQPYIVMEFVEGRQLTELDPDSLTPARAVTIMRQVLLGLSHAHTRGVIHRDLKLSNVMLVEMTGTDSLVKLLDFGLARLTSSAADPEVSLTQDGFVAGTPTYMSPEQCQGKTVDHRSDIYSAGVMLYTIATGKRPFQADQTAVLLHKQIHEEPMPPRKAAPQKRISEALERVILRAMEKKPDDRFQTAAAFVRAIDETLEGQATQTPTVARPRAARRGRLLWVAALLCVAAGATGALWLRAHYNSLAERITKLGGSWQGKGTPPDAGVRVFVPTRPRSVDAGVVIEKPPGVHRPDAAVVPIINQKAPEPTPAPTLAPPEPKTEIKPVNVAPAIPTATFDGGGRAEIEELRDRVAQSKGQDAEAQLRLGNIYAQRHWRPNAFEKWDAAFTLSAVLKKERSFRSVVCEAPGGKDPAEAEKFFKKHFGANGTPMLLAPCIKGAQDVARVDATVALLAAVSGEDRAERGPAALRVLELPKATCGQKKAAIETLGRLPYPKARTVLSRLEKRPPPQSACFGTAIADALAQMK